MLSLQLPPVDWPPSCLAAACPRSAVFVMCQARSYWLHQSPPGLPLVQARMVNRGQAGRPRTLGKAQNTCRGQASSRTSPIKAGVARTLAAWPLAPVAGLVLAGQPGQSWLSLAPYQLFPYVTTQPAGLYPATLKLYGWMAGWMGALQICSCMAIWQCISMTVCPYDSMTCRMATIQAVWSSWPGYRAGAGINPSCRGGNRHNSAAVEQQQHHSCKIHYCSLLLISAQYLTMLHELLIAKLNFKQCTVACS